MKQIEPARSYKGENIRIYFSALSDEEIENLIAACNTELQTRSQERIQG